MSKRVEYHRPGCQVLGRQTGTSSVEVEDVIDLPGMREALTELATRLAMQEADSSTSDRHGERRYVVGYAVTGIEVLRLFGADPSKRDSVRVLAARSGR